MKERKLPKMTEYKWSQSFYNEIVKEYNYRFPKYNPLNYPSQNEQQSN